MRRENMTSIQSQLREMDSKVNILMQKIQTIEKNEEIIGRTIVMHNNKIKKLESSVSKKAGGGGADMGEMEKKFAKKSELNELKYELNSINPLDFVTIEQVKELVREEVKNELKNK